MTMLPGCILRQMKSREGAFHLNHYPMKSFRSEKILIWNSGTQEQILFSLPDFLISKLDHWLRLCRAVLSVKSVARTAHPPGGPPPRAKRPAMHSPCLCASVFFLTSLKNRLANGACPRHISFMEQPNTQPEPRTGWLARLGLGRDHGAQPDVQPNPAAPLTTQQTEELAKRVSALTAQQSGHLKRMSSALTPQQIIELDIRLSTMRHDIVGHLSVIMAAMEMMRIKPEFMENVFTTLNDRSPKIMEEMKKFSAEFERTLGIR